jgi:hypothetical protein
MVWLIAEWPGSLLVWVYIEGSLFQFEARILVTVESTYGPWKRTRNNQGQTPSIATGVGWVEMVA